jgi:transposase
LTMVEQIFRTAKSLFATRPIFHKLDETIRGHVSTLASRARGPRSSPISTR